MWSIKTRKSNQVANFTSNQIALHALQMRTAFVVLVNASHLRERRVLGLNVVQPVTRCLMLVTVGPKLLKYCTRRLSNPFFTPQHFGSGT